MANRYQLKIIEEGVGVWNNWRINNVEDIDLSEAYLSKINLKEANLAKANLSRSCLYKTT